MKPPATSVPPNDAPTVDADLVEAEPIESLVTWATSTLLRSARMHLTPTPRAARPAHRRTGLPAVPLAG
jgi:hypothetical protein